MQILQWGGEMGRRLCGMLLPAALVGSSLVGSVLAEEGAPRRTKRADRPSAEAFPSSGATGKASENAGTTGQPDVPPDHPLARALKKAYASRKALEEVKDYNALFIKKERIKGTRKFVEQAMDLKLRHEPFSVYMKFRTPEAGREVIYVAGQNNGRLLVHEEGIKSIAGTIPLAINDPMVTKENRHPITQVGIVNMLDVIIAQWVAEAQFDEVDVKRYPKANLDGVACDAWVVTHPVPKQEFRFHKTVLYFDKQTMFPIHLEQWGWPPQAGAPAILVEDYTYKNLKTNLNLQNRDFDTRNPSYRFGN